MIKSMIDVEWASVKLGMLFSKTGISANAWTLLALAPAIIGFMSLHQHNLLLGLVLFILSGLIDAIDGAVARVTKSVSNLGAFLDGIIDRYVEILLYFGMLFYLSAEVGSYLLGFWVTLLVFGALMPTFVRAYADHRNVVTEPEEHRRMGGFIERFERLVLIYVGMFLGLYNTVWLFYAIVAVAVLSNLTAIQRIFFVVNYSRRTKA